MFKWKKKSQIWAPSLDRKWTQEFGQNPNALVLEDRIRIYFSSRKKNQHDRTYISYIFYIDVDKTDPSKIIYQQDQPILNSTGKGEPNAFDEFGTMPGSVIYFPDKKEVWMYYVGWQRPLNQHRMKSPLLPYQWANGLAISNDDGSSFHKMGNGKPILSSPYEYPFLHACPRVYLIDKNKWIMWFAAGTEWFNYDNRMNPVYIIKEATSTNGVDWKLGSTQIIPSVGKKECQSSASMFYYNGLYHMFFSYRDILTNQEDRKQYRIGYAYTDDLINWHRDDSQAGIDVSPTGWDSEAICYPHVIQVQDKIYMFYSGNQYGRSGFGYAELEKSLV